MKKWLTLLAVVAVGSGAFAAEGWMTDFEKAKEVAKEKNLPILIDFSGSDWCGWCIKLDKEVFSQQAFKDYAKDNLVMVLADFPSDKSKQSEELQAQNEKLAKEFDVQGFPTVYILNSDGKPIAKTGYEPGGPEAYIANIKKLTTVTEK
ncbi:MAG: thioredoxin fold domain-containing protein [Pontiella sp.]